MRSRGFPEVLSQFSAVSSRLAAMIEQEKIDPLIVNQLGALVRLFAEKEEQRRTDKSISTESAFTKYHAWRNLRLVTSKMKERFLEAERLHENPKAAVDGLKVLPSLLDTYTILVETEGRELLRDEGTETLNRVTELRNIAYHSRMLPSMREELQELDRKALLEEFERLEIEAQRTKDTPEDHPRD